MASSFGLSESFKCMICHDMAEDACETNCCHQLGCLTCLQMIKQQCPSCRDDKMTYIRAHSIQRAIKSVPIPCPNSCGIQTTKGELNQHKRICEKRVYKCNIKDCNFTGIENVFTEHILEKHKRDLLEKFDEFCEDDDEMEECPVGVCEEKLCRSDFREHLLKYHLSDMKRFGFVECMACRPSKFVKKSEWSAHNQQHFNASQRDVVSVCVISKNKPVILKNLEGRPVSMGRNGKFYCGLDNSVKSKTETSFKCSEDGNNCIDCMKLDLMFRNLAPYHLVNRNGSACRAESCFCSTNPNKVTFFNRKFGQSLCSQEKCGKNPAFLCSSSTFVKRNSVDKSGRFGVCGQGGCFCLPCLDLSEVMGKNNFYGSLWD